VGAKEMTHFCFLIELFVKASVLIDWFLRFIVKIADNLRQPGVSGWSVSSLCMTLQWSIRETDANKNDLWLQAVQFSLIKKSKKNETFGADFRLHHWNLHVHVFQKFSWD
jgi:hypothetical protein